MFYLFFRLKKNQVYVKILYEYICVWMNEWMNEYIVTFEIKLQMNGTQGDIIK